MRQTPPYRRIAFLCITIATTWLEAQDHAGEVVVPKASSPIALDGKTDEAAWAQAAGIGPLLMIETRGKPDHDTTHARLAHDAVALSIAVTCQAPRTEPGKRRARDDRAVYRADHIEVFLDPTPDSDDYYQLVIDRDGNVRDVWTTQQKSDRAGAAWNGDWRFAVANTEDGWTCEVALPYAVFGVEAVRPGDLWRLKIGRDAGQDGPLMWPPNPTASFHTRIIDGALYFDTRNLLRNPDFETGKVTNGAPEPWSASLTSSEVDNKPQGTVSTVEGGIAPGTRSLRVTKLATALWWPQVWNWGYKLAPGGVYEFSIMVKGTLPQVNLRATGRRKAKPAKMSHGVKPTKELTRQRFRFAVPEGSEEVGVGLSAPAGISGYVIYDDAILRRVLHADEATKAMVAAYAPPDFSPDPDPIHGLESLCERAGHKPWDLLWRDDRLLTYRVMFRDRKYGTDLWMLDKSPSIQYCVTASIWPGWNADGSVLMVNGARMTPDGTPRHWFCNADFSRMAPQPTGGMPLWDLENPDVYYWHAPGRAGKVNFRSGEQRVLATWDPRPRERSYGLTKDNRSVFITDHDGGLWVPRRPSEDLLPYVKVLDCYGQHPNRKDMFRTLAAAAELDDQRIFRILIGTRVYTDTGRTERVIAPLCGHNEYLKMFASGRVQFPSDAKLPNTKDIDELFQIYHLYPSCSHGHVSYSPDGEYVAWDGQATSYRVRDHDDQHTVRLSANGWVYHTCWFFDPRFYITCVRPYGRNYDRARNGGVVGQVFSDGTWQPVSNIKQRPAAYYYQGNFATLSRDATKVHYESSMTGLPKNYIAVMARPQPPRDIAWRTEGEAIVLKWTPPPHHKEIKGYLVYRSTRSGDRYRLMTVEPVAATTYTDTSVVPGRPYYYVVSSLEHAGLESGYSAEAARAGVALPARLADPLVVYAEMEDALVDLYTSDKPGVSQGRDRLGASNWYYVYRTPEAEQGSAKVSVSIPATADYFVWLRVRTTGTAPAKWALSIGPTAIGDVACPGTIWRWARAGTQAVRIHAGQQALMLATSDPAAHADLVCLVTDPSFVPEGQRPEDDEPPAPPKALTIAQVRDRAVQFTWQPSSEPDFWHYNVYAAPEPIAEPRQGGLLASPTYPELIDWGLRAGVTYHYTVTAVDRRGNESGAATGVRAAIPPRTHQPQQFELAFARAELKGKTVCAEAPGTRAEHYVMIPEKVEGQEASAAQATWNIDIKRTGKYYFWLRYLPKGGASSRGAAVRQAVEVHLDGKHIATLAGGLTDLSVHDSGVRPELWTWARPAGVDLSTAKISSGSHTLTVRNLTKAIRYDVLLITDEPSFQPPDGRLRQR